MFKRTSGEASSKGSHLCCLLLPLFQIIINKTGLGYQSVSQSVCLSNPYSTFQWYCEEEHLFLDNYTTEGMREVQPHQLHIRDFPPMMEVWSLQQIVVLRRRGRGRFKPTWGITFGPDPAWYSGGGRAWDLPWKSILFSPMEGKK